MSALQSDEEVIPFIRIKRAILRVREGKQGRAAAGFSPRRRTPGYRRPFRKKYEGYSRIAHGGIEFSVMDEMISSHLYELGHAAMTADLQVRFEQPVPLEEPIRFSSEVEDISKRQWKIAAEARLPSGEVIVTARAKFLPARFELNGESFDYEKKQTRNKMTNDNGFSSEHWQEWTSYLTRIFLKGGTTPLEVLKVSAKSNPNSVAGAVAGAIREKRSAEVQAIGAGALNQAIKAVAIARGFVAPYGTDLVCVPAFVDVQIEGEERTAIKLIIGPR